MRIDSNTLKEFGFKNVVGDKFKKEINNNIYYLFNGENSIQLSVLNDKLSDISLGVLLYYGEVRDMEDFKIILKRFYII